MALGNRQIVDIMAEIGLRLLEPIFNQILASPVGPGTDLTITLNPSSPLPATQWLYPGALIVVGWHASDAEVVEVIDVTGDDTFTGTLVNAHAEGESVFGATFPTQQTTDPVWTQAEIIGYIAQAQNEFLTKVPLIFGFTENQVINAGQIYQTMPNTAVELERVAVETGQVSFNISTITRSGGVVTAVLPTSVNSDNWTPSLGVVVMGVANATFNSASNIPFDLVSVSEDGLTLTWDQSGSNTASTGGYVSRPIWSRLYEANQNQIAMQNFAWQSNMGSPQKWFEDRSGVYGWGVAPMPDSNYWAELLTSVRGSESLGLLDNLLVPDVFAYGPIYRALCYAVSKEGVQRSPTLAKYFGDKFDFWVMIADRYLRNQIEAAGGQRA